MNDVEDLDGFAIVGIAGRFPGAPNVDALWDLISAGHSGISRFSREELEDNFDAATRDDPCYVAARPILENIDQFDADFFGMLPREAELTDPQQRVLLECAWHALEDAGCDPRRYAGAIGVFAGSSLNSYFLRHVCTDRTSLERFTSEYQVGSYQELIGALHDFVATRIAYKLDLKGPAVALQSGCSTSLLAVAQACESLAFFQCDMALAGGVSITLPQHRGYMYQEGGMVSPDGTCRPFDIAAAGTVFGSGAGMVALKRLADAIVDGDRIYAVVKGFGVNNDGAGKVGFTAPSVEGQANCIASALAMADISPETIGYVECHGTATPLGDPIEISGLAKAFDKMSNSESRRESVCVLGSIKANVGHLDAAAGVTGLIKTVMMLHRAEIPRQANFVTPNPRLMLDEHAFRVNTTGELWKRGAAPRRAGVSAFGVGGTNVHLVLEEAPLREPVQVAKRQSSSVVLSLSAHDPAALQAMRVALADRLERAPGDAAPLSLEDAALTLRKGRRAFDWRLAIAASDSNQAAAHLRSASLPQRASPSLPRIVLLFPGQGSQFPGMARALYELDPGFRSDIDHGAELLAPLIGLDIRPPLLDADPGDDDTRHPIHNTVLAQPALFLVEYSLARLLIRLGVKPDAMIGHSVGEFTAATIASVMAFDEALRLIASRGRLMQEQPGGAMLSVRLSPETLTSLLPEGVVIAADNAPNLVVASGPYEAVSELERRLDAEGAAYRRLHTSHAFHSPMIDPVVPVLTNEIGSIRLAVPQMPFFSCVSGKWITAEEATSADYWALHCRAPVQFRRSVESLLQELDSPAGVVFVEVGPGRVLSTLVDAVAERGSASRCVQTLPQCQTQTETEQAFAQALGSLWASGVPVDIGGVGPLGRHKCSMPAYPFQRKRHWIDAMSSVNNAIVEGPKSDTTFVHLHPAPESLMPAVDISSAVTKSIVEQVEKLQGRAVATDEYETSFLDLGCDSLMLGQLAQAVGRIFGVNLKFRQLMRDFPDIKALASHVVAVAPTEKLPAAASDAPTLQPSTPMIAAGPSLGSMPALPFAVTGGSAIQDLMRDQLTIMQSVFAAQLAALAGSAVPVKPAPSMASAPLQATVAASPAASAIAPPASGEPPSRFQIYRGSGGATELDAGHKQFLKSFMQRYNQKTPGSKARAQASREVLADPRSASGFNAIWKEMVYPLVCDYAKGARITDVDGNSYIDLVNGYGQTMFGHAPDFVVAAVEQQLHRGFPIGPQTKLAGDVSAKISAMTGNERVAFCNTGSEAVMAAMRIARTVTGRDRVVMFSGSYHGQFDEVLVRGLAAHAAPGAMPIAPGIPVDNLSSMVVLPNDRPESLAYVRAHADSLAAVIVEPVQSRHPDLVPTEFLRELRSITEKSGTVLVFDEVVTGFRVNPGGMQKVLGIRADLATYGKVLGGGMPIGVVAGRRVLMDALDGGTWRYGDDSEPEVSPTFFAGTFVRHPLVLAAAQAVLDHIETAGPALYDGLGASCHQLAGMINADFARHGLSIKAEHYASWLYLDVSREGPLASLLFPHLRFLGVNAQEGFPLFLTTRVTALPRSMQSRRHSPKARSGCWRPASLPPRVYPRRQFRQRFR